MSKIEDSVCDKIKARAEFGFSKYGTTLERKDLNTLQWLIHAQEEAMDLANYLEVLIQKELAKERVSIGFLLERKDSQKSLHGGSTTASLEAAKRLEGLL
jgi:hypothetical protein